MGITQVTVVIRNPAEPDRTWQGLFLVDTGAIDSLVPRPHLEAIGLKPKGQRVYGLADGSEVRLDITTGDIEFMGEIVGGTIIYGEADAEPLLGVTALESVGIEVDPRNQTLKRLPTTRLKTVEIDETATRDVHLSCSFFDYAKLDTSDRPQTSSMYSASSHKGGLGRLDSQWSWICRDFATWSIIVCQHCRSG